MTFTIIDEIVKDANSEKKIAPTAKTCNVCYESKPITEFYKTILNKDGLMNLCRECHIVRQQNYRKTKDELKFKEVAPHQKYWLQENKLKSKAHRKVSYAIKTGALIRQPCERCGATHDTADIVAHHEDYTKPLDVMWLCELHHKERHMELARMEKEKAIQETKIDMVNNPPHYTHGGIETITYIRAKLTPEQYIGYLRGNIEKYNSRIGLKGDSGEDAGKIAWYACELDRFINQRK
jgi:hypothetical protein